MRDEGGGDGECLDEEWGRGDGVWGMAGGRGGVDER